MSPKSLVLLLFIPCVISGNPLLTEKPVVDGFGINIHWTHPRTGELEMISEAGFKWVRVDFFWTLTEKSKGVYNFSDYEYLLQQLDKLNMSALCILAYDNPIYDTVSTESGRTAYVKWAATAILHLKGRGVIWEIWNEPNSNPFWKGQPPNATLYSKMALETIKAVREKTPDEIVIGPATSGVDLHFLEQCFRSGLLQYWDAVSVHPYRQTAPETSISDYLSLRELIAKYTPKGKHIPILSGEWGYSSVWSKFNDTIQAKYLQRELLHNILNNISISIWYDWQDGANKIDPENNFGIVGFEYNQTKSPIFEPKEAYLAAKTMSTALKGFKFEKRIHTNDTNDYVLLFRNEKNELRLTVWTTQSAEHNISIPSDKCDFEIIHHKGSPVQKASANGGTVVLVANVFVRFIVVKCSNNIALQTAPDFY